MLPTMANIIDRMIEDSSRGAAVFMTRRKIRKMLVAVLEPER